VRPSIDLARSIGAHGAVAERYRATRSGCRPAANSRARRRPSECRIERASSITRRCEELPHPTRGALGPLRVRRGRSRWTVDAKRPDNRRTKHRGRTDGDVTMPWGTIGPVWISPPAKSWSTRPSDRVCHRVRALGRRPLRLRCPRGSAAHISARALEIVRVVHRGSRYGRTGAVACATGQDHSTVSAWLIGFARSVPTARRGG